ncbi:hypothetical protein [Chryseobacterium sp. RR2-3-20]|uniref:hypothetical protein n=1 Tax=Chryseobacterium sp. RR2-3-20 TaxID=2787626 RepID=UPI001ADF1A69|nr:hypothetical protein [Chryseobacterium sp. RR2-3-20]
MPSTSEVGHAKNVANFADLIAYCTAYGTTYNPSKTALQLPSLNTLLTNAQTELSNVTTAKNTFDTVTGDRQLAFEPLKSLATKIFNYLSVTDATDQTIADAKTINNKLQGRRSGTITETPPTKEGGNTVSVSRQSYDMLTENFSALIDLVSSVPSYTPNETELTTASLTTFHGNLQTASTNVINAEVVYSNARISRNIVLYAENTGLVEIALEVKKYVKAVFGATSPQYKQISGIKFTSRKD